MTDRVEAGLEPFERQLELLGFDVRSILPAGYRVLSGVLALLLVISARSLQARYSRNVTRIRNFQLVVFLYAFLSLAILVVTPGGPYFRYLLACVPFAVIGSSYFLEARTVWKAEALVYLFLATMVFSHTAAKF
jgi:hypothetical protein